MKKFVITEEEKRRILNLYEQTETLKYSQFTQDFASMIGVPVDQVSWLEALNDNIDQNTKKQYFDLSKNQSKNIGFAISKIIRSNKFDEVIRQMESYSKPMSKDQKSMLDNFVDDLKMIKPVYQKKMNSMSQDEWDKFSQSNFPVDDSFSSETPQPTTTPSSDEKINTDHDRSYDYKLSGGKYYYTTKGQNNWVEAKGKGLEAIKSKVKF